MIIPGILAGRPRAVELLFQQKFLATPETFATTLEKSGILFRLALRNQHEWEFKKRKLHKMKDRMIQWPEFY